MCRKNNVYRVTFWRVLRNLGRLPRLIENVRRLYVRVGKLGDDSVINRLVVEIERDLGEMFG